MNKKGLRQFLTDCNKAGYAGGEEKNWIKEPNGSTTILFKKGPWKSHDNFFGGEPYGGRTVVFFKGKPAWIIIYYGWVVESVKTNLVYGVLRNALMRMPKNHPFRGPKTYKESSYIYRNSWDGNIEQFSGEEKITKGKRLIYKAHYIGGLVDQRKGI